MLPCPFRGFGAQWSYVKTQESGHTPRSELKRKVKVMSSMIKSKKRGLTTHKRLFVKLLSGPKKVLVPLHCLNYFLAFFLT